MDVRLQFWERRESPTAPRVRDDHRLKWLQRGEARERRRDRRRARWAKRRSPLLTIAGLGFISIAASRIHLTLGLFTIGLCLFLLEWLTRPDDQQ
jgi:hypothetical protein